jgi:hypothetical protein
LFAGEAGSGRRHAARCLHAISNEPGSFVVVPIGDRAALEAALREGRGTVFLPSIEQLPWSAQESLAAQLAPGAGRPRIVGSIGIDPARPTKADCHLGWPRRLPNRSFRCFRCGTAAGYRDPRGAFVRSCVVSTAFHRSSWPRAMAALERCAWRGVAQLRGRRVGGDPRLHGTVRLRDRGRPRRGGQGRRRRARRPSVPRRQRLVVRRSSARPSRPPETSRGNVTGAAEHRDAAFRPPAPASQARAAFADFRRRGASSFAT